MPSQRPAIPAELVEAFKARRAAVFVGAGVSQTAGLPGWDELVSELAKSLGISPGRRKGVSFPLIAQYYLNEYGLRSLGDKVKDLLDKRGARPSKAHTLLAQLPCDLFYTTNLDPLLEKAFTETVDIVRDERTARTRMNLRMGVPQVRKIHGSVEEPESYVLTSAQYARFEHERYVLTQALRYHLSSFHFLFIGYSMSDPDFNSIYEHVLISMGEMARRHYALLLSPSDHEKGDLRKRSITAIDLKRWRGASNTARLEDFLNELLDSSSELVHIQRLFKLPDARTVPIIVSSKINQEEGYVHHTACDIHAANKIQAALAKMGLESSILPDMVAMENPKKFLSDHVILVCSPFANTFTEYVFNRAAGIKCSIAHRFVEVGAERRRQIVDDRGRRWIADDTRDQQKLGATGPEPRVKRDYALAARYRSPWAQGKYIYVFCGIYTVGTQALGDLLGKPAKYGQLPLQQDEFAVIVELEYRKFNPTRYKYTLKRIYH